MAPNIAGNTVFYFRPCLVMGDTVEIFDLLYPHFSGVSHLWLTSVYDQAQKFETDININMQTGLKSLWSFWIQMMKCHHNTLKGQFTQKRTHKVTRVCQHIKRVHTTFFFFLNLLKLLKALCKMLFADNLPRCCTSQLHLHILVHLLYIFF